ncbi:hypothetical protein, partial [Lactobacillus delbrueckii]|uniref:hypothetical protein n=1 Tax=Lactobacillus delbrueckii TaxID=1584 RepID=UPI001E6257E9
LNRTLTANILRRDSQLNGEAASFIYDIMCPKDARHWLHLHFIANFPEQSNSSPLRKCPKPAKILYF